MDPFHVVSLAARKLDECRRRIQRVIAGRRGRAGDPLYRARRTLHTGAGLLTDTQARRLQALFADERHVPVTESWGVYQRLTWLIVGWLGCWGLVVVGIVGGCVGWGAH